MFQSRPARLLLPPTRHATASEEHLETSSWGKMRQGSCWGEDRIDYLASISCQVPRLLFCSWAQFKMQVLSFKALDSWG